MACSSECALRPLTVAAIGTSIGLAVASLVVRTACVDTPEAGLKFQMAKNSIFAILLRSPWWISLLIAVVLSLLGLALLPDAMRAVGALMGLPFAVVCAIAVRRQWHQPSAARVDETRQALANMAWPAFAALLEQAFRRDGYTVQRSKAAAVDFELERKGRRMLVCARRWKSARTGLEALRPLQAAREAGDAPDALYIGLGSLTDTARPFAAEHAITVWDAPELAHALRGLSLSDAAAR
jgi:restriction system protein